MSFKQVFSNKPCPNCGNDDFTPLTEAEKDELSKKGQLKGYDKCNCCGTNYDHSGLFDYSSDFEIQDNKNYDDVIVHGDLRKFFSYDFKGRDELAGKTFDILKQADKEVFQSRGFSVNKSLGWGSFKDLCQRIYKYHEMPGPSAAKEHKNPFDDSVTVNIFDTLGSESLNSEGKQVIRINADEIRKKHQNKDGIIVLTILHEMMHAAMRVENEGGLYGDYWYYKEEAYANAFALKLLFDTQYYEEALTFISNSASGYNAGIRLAEADISMEEWRQEKTNTSKTSAALTAEQDQ